MPNKRLLASLLCALALACSPGSAFGAEPPAVETEAARSGWYYSASEAAWYYYNPATHEPQTGWVSFGGAWYYFDPATGREHYGWLKWGGNWYYFDPGTGKERYGWHNEGTAWYYFDPSSGAELYGWQRIGGAKRYFWPNSGKAAVGWAEIDGVFYPFGSDGKLVSAETPLPAADAERMASLSARQQALLAACDRVPWPGANLCAGWVSQVFSAAGLGIVPGNACDIAYAWATSANIDDLEPGMIIAVPTHPRTDAGRIWGHVGIYAGNGLVRDSARTGLRTVDLASWIGWYGATYPVKWGWANGIALA